MTVLPFITHRHHFHHLLVVSPVSSSAAKMLHFHQSVTPGWYHPLLSALPSDATDCIYCAYNDVEDD